MKLFSLESYPPIFLLLVLLLQLCMQPISTNSNIPRLSLTPKSLSFRKLNDNIRNYDDFHIYHFNQTIDHFNFAPQSYEIFSQKYIVNFNYWGGQNSNCPIFAYLGAEDPLSIDVVNGIGIINDNAPGFQALTVFIEHRFYGESVPYGLPMDEAIKNETIRGYFNSAQALADYAQILLHIKQQFSAQKSPVIVFGGSYGGMLASWFRLKYPHVALGALAVSAPVLYFDNIVPPQNGYFSIVTKDFMETSHSCHETIKNSWAEIDRIGSTPEGLSILSQRFKTCSQLSSSRELKDSLVRIYANVAQYDYTSGFVRRVCEGIDGAPAGTDVIGRIYTVIVSLNLSCLGTYMAADAVSQSHDGWSWQTCSELVIPIGRVESDTMFEASPFNLSEYIQSCEQTYGVTPRPHWITTYYGGLDIKLVLKSFGSNIIFSNGLRDPYSCGGVLEDINESVVAITTLNGSHCVDIAPASETDPHWLVAQRNKELVIIRGWIQKYYINLGDDVNAGLAGAATPSTFTSFFLLIFLFYCYISILCILTKIPLHL